MRYILSMTAVLSLMACQGQQLPEPQTVSVNLPSVQCSMCEGTITDALMATGEVDSVTIDLKSNSGTIYHHSASLTVEALEVIISGVGYDVNNRKADPVAYENLPGCCKIPEDEDGSVAS